MYGRLCTQSQLRKSTLLPSLLSAATNWERNVRSNSSTEAHGRRETDYSQTDFINANVSPQSDICIVCTVHAIHYQSVGDCITGTDATGKRGRGTCEPASISNSSAPMGYACICEVSHGTPDIRPCDSSFGQLVLATSV